MRRKVLLLVVIGTVLPFSLIFASSGLRINKCVSVGNKDSNASGAGAGNFSISATPFAAVVDFCFGERYNLLSRWASKNHKLYSKMHRYDYYEGTAETFPEGHFFTPSSWGKIGFL